MDLINRQDAIAIATQEGAYGYISAQELAELPSAERKGHWEYLYNGNYKCSNCGSWWGCVEEPCEEGLNYCPNCGADMRGEEDA